MPNLSKKFGLSRFASSSTLVQEEKKNKQLEMLLLTLSRKRVKENLSRMFCVVSNEIAVCRMMCILYLT